MENEIQNLLNQVSIITRKNTEIMEANGGRFNMFGVLGVDHYENTHSSIIKEFLNPHGSHGLKSQFLNLFIEQLSNQFSHLNGFKLRFITENAHAYTEYYTENGRIDILIEDMNGHAIIIENKIYALDQQKQLKRYNEFALHKYKKDNYIILYLTIDGVEASEDSGKDVNYIQISYSDFIIDWLEKCVLYASRFSLVRETIIQYINHLKKLTNQDMNVQNSNEIVSLLSSSNQNIEAAITINENFDALCDVIINDIIEQKLKPQMEDFAIKNDLCLFKILGNAKMINIVFEKSSWKKCRMLINTEGINIYGFSYKDPDIKIDNSVVEILNKKYPKGNTSHWWPIYIRMNEYKYINLDLWRNEIKTGLFGECLIKLFTDLLKVVTDKDL